MRSGRSLASGRLGVFWLAALAVAVAMRMLIPAGFMLAPAVTAHGLPKLVICAGKAPPEKPAMHAMAGHQMPGDSPQGHGRDTMADHPCAFAAAGATATAPAAPPAAVIPVRAVIAAAPPSHAFACPGLGLAAPPPPKTGPPAFA